MFLCSRYRQNWWKNVALMTVFNTIYWWYLKVADILGHPVGYLLQQEWTNFARISRDSNDSSTCLTYAVCTEVQILKTVENWSSNYLYILESPRSESTTTKTVKMWHITWNMYTYHAKVKTFTFDNRPFNFPNVNKLRRNCKCVEFFSVDLRCLDPNFS